MNNINAKDKIACAMSDLQLGGRKYMTDTLVNKIRAVWDFLPSSIPDYFSFNTNIVGDPWLIYPYDKELISTIISIFENEGWETNWSTRESEVGSGFGNQNPKVKFSHPKTNLIVMCEFNDSLTGSTCKRKVIGTRQVEEDIVEFVCNDEVDND